MKLYYDLKIKGMSIRLFGDISNVMNKANVLAVDNTTGEPDATLDSGQPPMYVWKPYYFSPPRHIEIGISIGQYLAKIIFYNHPNHLVDTIWAGRKTFKTRILQQVSNQTTAQ